ncbi:MAG: EVE domain-containing protein [Thermosynechococcaceae cyanobacterium]
MPYWLMKTEPSVFSWADLQALPNQTTPWEGVRNYQARNFMRDEMKLGDRVLFYHSGVKPPAIMGIAQVVREAYPDDFAWDADSPYYDPKSSPDNPRWVRVDLQYHASFSPPITLAELKQMPDLEGMMLLQKGSRLSVQPVTSQQWAIICNLRR